MTIWLLLGIACAVLLMVFLSLRVSRQISMSFPPPPPHSPDRGQRKLPQYADPNVLFTVYRPKAVVPGHWYKLLAFAHLAERRPDAAPDSSDPVQVVEREARQILGKRIADQLSTRQQSAQPIPREGEIVFAPHVEGIIFNPPAQGILWLRDVHRVEFELTAAKQYEGQLLSGSLTIFLGSLILADIPLTIRADSTHTPIEDEPFEQISARPYRKIFASYSRRDVHIVEEFEHYAETMGDKYLRDLRTLRSGEEWDKRLHELIEEAEIFQLFWSSNSMRSKSVCKEWKHALSLKRPNFIRPMFWEEPMPQDEELPPAELARLHFHKLRRPVVPTPPSAGNAQKTQPASGSFAAPILSLLLISGFFLSLAVIYLNPMNTASEPMNTASEPMNTASEPMSQIRPMPMPMPSPTSAAGQMVGIPPYNVPLLGVPTFRRGDEQYMSAIAEYPVEGYAVLFPQKDGVTLIRMQFFSPSRIPAYKRIVGWTVSPRGKYTKLRLIIDTSDSDPVSLRSETTLPDFGLLVTIENSAETPEPTGSVFAKFNREE